MSRPLLVVDGDSFAHRAYHALPKSIRRRGNKGGGAIVGFANFLVRLHETEQPRAVLVGWDTLDAPTYRHRAFAPYQAGRQFDAELIDQLDVLPEFVKACGFAYAKAPGYEADDFVASAAANEERHGGTATVASGDRDAYQLASGSTTILQPLRAGEMARIGPAEVRERYGVEHSRLDQLLRAVLSFGPLSDLAAHRPYLGAMGKRKVQVLARPQAAIPTLAGAHRTPSASAVRSLGPALRERPNNGSRMMREYHVRF